MFRIYFFDGLKGFLSLALGTFFFCQLGLLGVASPYVTPIVIIVFPYLFFLYNTYLGFYHKTVFSAVLWMILLFTIIFFVSYFRLYTVEESVYNPDKVFLNPALKAAPFSQVLNDRVVQFVFAAASSFITVGFVSAGFIYFDIINTVYNVFTVLENARAPFFYYIAAFPFFKLFYWLSYSILTGMGVYIVFSKVLKREKEEIPLLKSALLACCFFLIGLFLEFLTKDFYLGILRDVALTQ